MVAVQAAGGIIAGATASCITTPFDTIKTRLQVPSNLSCKLLSLQNKRFLLGLTLQWHVKYAVLTLLRPIVTYYANSFCYRINYPSGISFAITL